VPRVIIIEDDPAVANYVSLSIANCSELQLAGIAGTVAEARQLARLEPDLMIVDLGLPDGDGLSLIREIRSRADWRPGILVLSVLGDQNSVIEAVLAGADGYLLKDQEGAEIARQCLQVLAGGSPLSPEIAAKVLVHIRTASGNEAQSETAILSARERELLRMFSEGKTNKQAATSMAISPHTVAEYTKSILRKLGATSRGEAIARAFRKGLLGS